MFFSKSGSAQERNTKALGMQKRKMQREIETLERGRQQCLQRAARAVDRNDRSTVRSEASQALQMGKMKETLQSAHEKLVGMSMQQQRVNMVQNLNQTLENTAAMFRGVKALDPEKIALRTAEMQDHQQRLALNESMLDSAMESEQSDAVALDELVTMIYKKRELDTMQTASCEKIATESRSY